MKIPGVFAAIILTVLSPASAAFTDMSIPQNLQKCFTRMSRSSDSYPIFSPASRQRYCVKQYLNRRQRTDWLLEPELIPDRNELKTTDLTPPEPQFNDDTTFWSPPIKQWQFPTVTNFWQPKTQFWPVAENKIWKPQTKSPQLEKIWRANSFIPPKKSKSIISESAFVPKREIFQTTTLAPLDWERKQFLNNIPSNPTRRNRFWRAPIWSVFPSPIRIPGIKFNSQWLYPNWVIDEPWNEYNNAYNLPKYPLIAVETLPE